MLRQWKTPDARVLRVVVADEDEKEDHHTETRQDEEVLDTDQRKELEEILLTFTDVVNSIPGRVHLLQHSINTRDSSPLRTAPHRLPVKWKDQLHTEVKDLLEAGIIRVSHSPWSSPIVPVRKKEGSIRLCVDFRQINQVTVPDPYLMPRVDDILDCLGEAKYLTELDLNKGFHQVPMYQSDIEKTSFCTE